ncbi:MAG: DUF655 domain-containing protein [Candidatus Thermoplasmatota archaeon]|nr:DUF655 domain-containing protein [Candidatus Thermoplasmatota archaeon]
MQPNGDIDSDAGDGPFASETHIRVLDVMERRPVGWEIHAISEPGLHIVRSRLNDGFTSESGDHFALDSGKSGPLSTLRFQDLSGDANSALQEAVAESIKVNPDPHLGFYNRANNISLKVHAFQLLPGVGSSTARSWVEIRGPNGWIDLDEVSQKLDIDAVVLLAERYVSEMENPGEVPCLLELLVRAGA